MYKQNATNFAQLKDIINIIKYIIYIIFGN